MKDLKNDIAVKVALNLQEITSDTTTDGVSIDLLDNESVTFVAQSGTITDGTFTPVIEESDTGAFGGEETAVADSDLIGTEANAAFVAADDNEIRTLAYRGDKRFVRYTLGSTGTTSGGFFSVAAVLGHGLTKKEITNLDEG